MKNLKEYFVDFKTLHITICMLTLETEEHLDLAKEIMEKCKNNIV